MILNDFKFAFSTLLYQRANFVLATSFPVLVSNTNFKRSPVPARLLLTALIEEDIETTIPILKLPFTQTVLLFFLAVI